jgi:hypothetical protein
MSNETFIRGLNELYQGEVIGEVILNRLLSLFSEPEIRYKIAVMLQLETETKARLRPTLMQLNMDIAERDEIRQTGLDIVKSMEVKNWRDTMSVLFELVEPAVERYRNIAIDAPLEYRAVAESMVVHEKSLLDFIEQELAGEGDSAVLKIIAQLNNVPPKP